MAAPLPEGDRSVCEQESYASLPTAGARTPPSHRECPSARRTLTPSCRFRTRRLGCGAHRPWGGPRPCKKCKGPLGCRRVAPRPYPRWRSRRSRRHQPPRAAMPAPPAPSAEGAPWPRGPGAARADVDVGERRARGPGASPSLPGAARARRHRPPGARAAHQPGPRGWPATTAALARRSHSSSAKAIAPRRPAPRLRPAP